MAVSGREFVGRGLLEVTRPVEVRNRVVAMNRTAPEEDVSILRTGLVVLCLTPGKCRTEGKTVGKGSIP
jgi:hypothetical protein